MCIVRCEGSCTCEVVMAGGFNLLPAREPTANDHSTSEGSSIKWKAAINVLSRVFASIWAAFITTATIQLPAGWLGALGSTLIS